MWNKWADIRSLQKLEPKEHLYKNQEKVSEEYGACNVMVDPSLL